MDQNSQNSQNNQTNQSAQNAPSNNSATLYRDNEETEIDLAEVFFVLVRKWFILLLACLAAAAVTFGVTKFLITPQYEATSMIYILGKTTSISNNINLQLSQQLTVDFQTLATSRPVLEAVIKDCNLDTTYEKLLATVKVENPSNTSILKMTATNKDPKLAAAISNAMSTETANRVAEVMVTDKPSQVEEAVVPDKKASPSVMRDTAVGGLVGLLLAVAVIVVMHITDDTIKTEDDVKKYLNLSTLAAFPLDKSVQKDKKDARRHRKAAVR